MKKSFFVFVMLAVILFVSACTTLDGSAFDTTTVDTPKENTTVSHPDSNNTTSENTNNETSNSIDSTTNGPTITEIPRGTLLIEPFDYLSWPFDSCGPYLDYEGGEITLPFTVKTTGSIGDNGVGLLVFIDGQPQPYKTKDEPEYTYLHTFYPDKNNSVFDLIFTPITGQTGDFLEIYISSLLYPSYSTADGNCGWVYTQGSTATSFRINYLHTPPAEEFPEKQPWLTEVSVNTSDTPKKDVIGWADFQLREQIETRFLLNGAKKNVYQVSVDTPINLQFAIWGSPYVHYGLVFFIDNVPVAQGDTCHFYIDVQERKTTTIDATLYLPQFDGESVIYAVLVPRNYHSSEVSTTAFL